MRSIARVLVLALVAVFAAAPIARASILAQSAGDAPMMMQMAPGEEMPGCGDCGDSSDLALACVAACALPALGLAAPIALFVPINQALGEPTDTCAITGQLRTPEPYPPRPSILD